MTTTIKVEQRHIDAGERASAGNCAIALAIKESFGTERVWAGVCNIDILGRLILTPAPVSDFIIDFDRERPVSPFEFELPLK